MRKHSYDPSSHVVEKLLPTQPTAIEDGQDYAPAFRKKMSVPVNQRISAQVGRLPADPLAKTGVRFKKVGNLMTLDTNPQNNAPRVNTLSKPGNQNLFLKNVFNEQNAGPQKVAG